MSLKVIITNVITDVISNVINLLFTPIDVSGLTFWTKAKILARSGWPTTTDQLKNEVGAPHLQIKTGSGVNLATATTDYIDTNNILGSVTSFVYLFNFKCTANNLINTLLDSRDSGSDGIIASVDSRDASGNGKITIGANGETLETLNAYDDSLQYTAIVGLDSNDKLFINTFTSAGVVVETVTADYTGGAINILVSSKSTRTFTSNTNFFNGQIESFAVWKNITVDYTDLSYYAKWLNNPQLEADATALMFYRLSEGKYLDGDIAINEGTGGNATVLTTGASSYDMAVNGLADGFQLGLSGYNRYYQFNGAASDEIVYNSQISEFNTYNVAFPPISFSFIHLDSGSFKVIFSQQDGSPFDGVSCYLIGNKIRFGIIATASSNELTVEANFTLIVGRKYDAVINYDGSKTASGITISIDNSLKSIVTIVSTLTSNTASPSTNFTLGNTIGGAGANNPKMILLNLSIGTLFSTFGYDFIDNSGSLIPAIGTSLKRFNAPSLTAEGLIDYFNNAIQNPWKTGRINCLGGLHSGTTAINVGNTRTLAFGIYVADASVNQTIFETGSNDITLTSSAIASADFSTITVNRSTNTITDATLLYVELKNGSDVALTALRLKENFDGIIIPFETFTGQISEADSKNLYTYFQTLY